MSPPNLPPVKTPPVLAQPALTVRHRPLALPGKTRRAFYQLHPLSGALVIFIDNLLFGVDAISFGFIMPIVALLAFLMVGTGVFLIQWLLHRDRLLASVAKGFVAGFLAGIPTSITGTIFGTAVLFVSGLSIWNRRKIL